MKHLVIVTSLTLLCGAAAAAAGGPPTGAADKRPAADAPPAATATPEEYRMSPGDKLRIEVYKDPQLSQSVQVRPDGKVTLPLIGDIMANGRTPLELRDGIGAALKEYITNPTVTVIVVEAATATAYVMGEVNHPGAVSLATPLTVMQALAMAGGLKDFADAKNIRIIRKGAYSDQIIPFNYREAIKSTTHASIYLRAGDTIVVPD
ncbi:MAG TPA: polysaccharide biosynthesis/export family protein [Vicinamibacterales bacterium]|jgi:polysaccharide export outer membrane protein